MEGGPPSTSSLQSAAALAEAQSDGLREVVDAVCETAAVEAEVLGGGTVLALQRVLFDMGGLLSRLHADPYRPLPSEGVFGGDSASPALREELAAPPPKSFESDEAADRWVAAALTLAHPPLTITPPHDDDDAAASASSPLTPDGELDAAELQDRMVDALVTDADEVRVFFCILSPQTLSAALGKMPQKPSCRPVTSFSQQDARIQSQH